MPNWCSTALTITADSAKDAETIENLINFWQKPCGVENGFGDSWLGNVLVNSGLQKKEAFESEDVIPCRGMIHCVSRAGEQVYVDMDTAWKPMLEMWVLIRNKWFPQTEELLYEANEPGNEIHLTNNPDLAGKWVVQAEVLSVTICFQRMT